METAEKIAVMQAYEDGKKIQFKRKGSDSWLDCSVMTWNWGRYEYRIKPEKPAYRPYKDTEEMIADFRARFKERFGVKVPPYAMPLIWIKSGVTRLITDYVVTDCYTGNTRWTMSELFEMCTYLDGSPIGKLVEE